MAKNNVQAIKSEEAQQELGFLESLSTLATPVTDLSAVVVRKDPLLNTRAKFAQNCDEQIKLLKAGNEGRWFRKIANGLVLTLRNGNIAMTLNGATHFQVPNAEAAIKLLEAAKVAAEKGEIDEPLKKAARAPRKSKQEQQQQEAKQ